MSDCITFSGVHLESGEAIHRPVDLSAIRMKGWRNLTIPRITRADYRWNDLSRAGWGVIFPRNCGGRRMQALSRLLQKRSAQAGERYRSFEYEPWEDADAFLSKRGVGPGSIIPARVPFYLLIVADPGEIPFSFQYQLDVQYAVGRVSFPDLDDYRLYAENIAAAEESPVGEYRQAALFGIENQGDELTAISSQNLAQALFEKLGEEKAFLIRPEDTSKAKLQELIQSSRSPSLLFTAGHGVFLEPDNDRIRDLQGALICNDWQPGRTMGSECYFAADDVKCNLDLRGTIPFHFACFSAGTPRHDQFARMSGATDTELTDDPFVAKLPQEWLRRGAPAVIGQVGKAYTQSFLWKEAGSQVQSFERTLKSLSKGNRVGLAMESFGQRYADLATRLVESRIKRRAQDDVPENPEEAHLWVGLIDARSYVVLGDPAAKLPVAPKKGNPATLRRFRPRAAAQGA